MAKPLSIKELGAAVAQRSAAENITTMLATLLLEPGRLELKDVEIPKAGPGEVVVRVRTALTCGTDLKTFRRGHPKIPMPTMFGHEFSGDIYQIGDGVTEFQVGDQVMSAPTAPCGECVYCTKGQDNLCSLSMETMINGAYAEYVRIPAHIVRNNMFKKPAHLSYGEAAMLEPLSCVVYGMDQVSIGGDDTVLVIGAGAIGLMHLMVAKALGAGRVIVAGRWENRLKVAKAMGADAVIGVTCHGSRDLAIEAAAKGADYVAFGAFYPTATKDAIGHPDLEILSWWSEVMTVPCVAIGGISAANCAPLVKAGADFIAVLSAVWNHADGPGEAVKLLNTTIAEAQVITA